MAFDNIELTAAISRSTLNRGTFPTAGSQQTLSVKATTPNSDTSFFKVNLDTKWYFPISRGWSFKTSFRLGYGNGYGEINGNDQILPFWENFRAGGGSDTLRGFETNVVGPRAIYRYPTQIPGTPDPVGSGGCCLGPDHDVVSVSQRSVGGNALAIAGVELIFPVPFLDESVANSVRTSLFVDAGSVWDTEFNVDDYQDLAAPEFAKIVDYSDPGQFRASAGLSVQWLSPMGPLIFSLAKALKKEEGDDTKFFNFNIGKTF